MTREDLSSFIRDITRRNELVWREQMAEWAKMHERSDRLTADVRELSAEIRAMRDESRAMRDETRDLRDESRAQREGLFQLIAEIRRLREDFGGAAA